MQNRLVEQMSRASTPEERRQTTSRSITPETVLRGKIDPERIGDEYIRHYNMVISNKQEKLLSQAKLLTQTLEEVMEEESPHSTNQELTKKFNEVKETHKKEALKKINTLKEEEKNLKRVDHELPPCVFTTGYQYRIDDLEDDDKRPRVTHCGIDVRDLNGLAKFPIDVEMLHPVEKATIAGALGKLKDVPDAKSLEGKTSVLSPNNVVLVDIIARNPDGSIKEDQEKPGFPETHTVAIWKVNDKEYCVIDPNRDKFSEHLTKEKPSILENSFPGLKFTQHTGDLYNTKDSPQKRDCIDIAVKVAFTINEQEKAGSTEDKIKEYVQNRFDINVMKNPFYKGPFSKDAMPPREMFASDPGVRANVEKIVKGLVEHVETTTGKKEEISSAKKPKGKQPGHC